MKVMARRSWRFTILGSAAASYLLSSAPVNAYDSTSAPRTHTEPGFIEGSLPYSSIPIEPVGAPPSDNASNNNVRYFYDLTRRHIGPNTLRNTEGDIVFDPAEEDFYSYPGLYECPDYAFQPEITETRLDLNQCFLATGWNLEPYRMQLIRDREEASGLNPGDSLPRGSRMPPDSNQPNYLSVPAWLSAHQAWNHWMPFNGSHDFHSEHEQIARVAADASGLLDRTSIFERFWLRYPTTNKVVAAPQADEESGGNGYFTVAQSLQPWELISINAEVQGGAPSGLATRGVSLLELTQLPDFSHSLDDWARGNETCRIDTVVGMYRDVHEVQACHEFEKVMGSLNASHFYPLSKHFYAHYHELAMRRMRQCGEAALPAAAVDDYFWGEDEPLWNAGNDMAVSPEHTFGHVCEREAMAYEMIAQHYLQDGWSTGHMWHRWGFAEMMNPEDPDDSSRSFNYHLPGEVPGEIPTEHQQPRRAGIAAMTAMVSGQIHGARAVVERLLRDRFGQDWVGRMATNLDFQGAGLLDDPLTSPILQERDLPGGGQILTSWLQGEPTDAENVFADYFFPGAGDLYWNPRISILREPGGEPEIEEAEYLQIKHARTYAEMRNRLIACSAASMIEVYQSGSQVHGSLGSDPIYYHPLHGGDPILLTDTNDAVAIATSSDYCWGQLASNFSMEQATGITPELRLGTFQRLEPNLRVTDFAKVIVGAYGRNFAGILANHFAFEEVGGALNFYQSPPPEQPFDENVPCTEHSFPDDRICDREKFMGGTTGGLLGRRMILDTIHAAAQFRVNVFFGSTTVAAARRNARLRDAKDNSINMLGVPPSGDYLVQPRDVGTPVASYVDVSVDDYESFRAPQQVFWRGRVREICDYTHQNWSSVESLRAACQAGREDGADVAACTTCVELASLHAPVRELDLGPGQHPAANQSACSLVGSYGLTYLEGSNEIAGAPAALPPEWFRAPNSSPEAGEIVYEALWTPGKVAFHWCTGTPSLDFEERPIGQLVPQETNQLINDGCPRETTTGTDFTPHGTVDVISAWVEQLALPNSLLQQYPPEGKQHITERQQFLPEVFTIREHETRTLVTDCDAYPPYFSSVVSDYTARVQSMLGLLPLIDNAEYGTHNLQSSHLEVPVCGETRAYSSWSLSCEDLRAYLAGTGYLQSFSPEITEPPAGEPWNPSYAQFVPVGSGCVLREPARFRTCPSGSVCGADGRCRLHRPTCAAGDCLDGMPLVEYIH